MKRSTVLLGSALVVTMFASQGVTSDLFLHDINETCNTNYTCSICHQDSSGGGELKKNGAYFVAQNYEPCAFCSDACKERAEEKSVKTH